jgi:hypothetical protein
MRKLFLSTVVCLGIFGAASSQNSPSKHEQLAKLIMRDYRYEGKDSLYILNDSISSHNNDFKHINVLTIDRMPSTEAVSIYGSEVINGAVVFITQDFAVKAYQKKFSEVSLFYKQFIERDKEKDTPFSVFSTYYIDGKKVHGDQKEITTKLYSLAMENIASLIMDSIVQMSYAPTIEYKIFITTQN